MNPNAETASAGSRFERLASQGGRLPAHTGNLLGLLLAESVSADSNGSRFAPIWAEEAMHRAHAMLMLLGRRTAREQDPARDGLSASLDCALAGHLAAAYRSLRTAPEQSLVPCSPLLRAVALNLGGLFGRGGIVVTTDIERMDLPAYQRRALVLCASELVVNALTHAFPDCDGRIDVSLRRLDGALFWLRVADNGAGLGKARPDTKFGVAGSLASLLPAGLGYDRTGGGATTAEVVFPVAVRPHRLLAR